MNDMTRNTMISNDLILENLYKSFRIEFKMCGLELDCFSEPIDDSKDGVISLTFWKGIYKVNSDNFPGLSWWFKRMKGGFCQSSMRFGALTDFTSRSVPFNITMNSRPPVVMEDTFDSLELSVMF